MNIDPTVLGVSGVTVAILLGFIKALWDRYQAVLQQAHEDQGRVVAALESASAALHAATEESIRARALAERDRA